MSAPAVVVRNLRIGTADGRRCLVDDACLELAAGEVIGIVGESGSSKTTLGLALLHHCRRGLHIEAGTVQIRGHDLCAATPAMLRQLRGHLVSYVPQDPASALNPALRIGTQLAECLPPERRTPESLLDLLAAVKLPRHAGFLQCFPHQMSGGQLQRVAIAMAFANRPALVVMDEPTTGLDVSTQAHVLDTVRELCAAHGVAALYISHDIAVVAAIARRVAVVYGGRIVEIGPTADVLRQPQHPYTRALMRAVPDVDLAAPVAGIPGQAPETGADLPQCSFAPRCPLATGDCRMTAPALVALSPAHQVRCCRIGEREEPVAAVPAAAPQRATARPLLTIDGLRAHHGHREVLHGVSLSVAAGECVGLVGESGSGKTTLARCIAGLHAAVQGSMTLDGVPLPASTRDRSDAMRRRIQYVFQNPYGSFNPRRPVGASLAIVLSSAGRLSGSDRRRKVLAALDQVALPAATADRYPRELSGGQRQRAAIARALITDPDLLICDEITSALDVSVQAVITELLCRLQQQRGLAMLFVTHNLAVVRSISQRIVVMQNGHLAEAGLTEEVMTRPKAEETQRLLRDAPRFPEEHAGGKGMRPDQKPTGYDLCIRNGTVVTASERFRADVGVRDGRIVDVGTDLPRADRDVDASGLLVLPGGVDAHCHIEEPAYRGALLADDFDSASRAAACGGTTTIMPFVNHLDGATMRESAEDYAARARARSRIDYAFHMIFGEAAIGSIAAELPGLMADGYLSVKVFMNYQGYMLDDERILQVMDTSRRHGGVTMVHAENGHCVHWLSDRLVHSHGAGLEVFAATSPAAVEREATHRAITLAEISKARVLLVHVSSAEAVEQIRWAHGRGIAVLAETCPQYLVRSVDDLSRPGWEAARFMCSPPLRDAADAVTLWRGLQHGTFHLVSSDHCPYSIDGPSGKRIAGPTPHFQHVPPGLPGLETRLMLLYSEGVGRGHLSLEQFVALTATNPARIYGLYPRKGSLMPGADADIVLWDPALSGNIRHADLHDACDYTPYEGQAVCGMPVTTFSRGERIWDRGAVLGSPGRGRLVPRVAAA